MAAVASAAMVAGIYPVFPALMLARRGHRRLSARVIAREWARGVAASAARISRLTLAGGDPRGRRPVVLVHGYAMSTTSFVLLARRLAAAGFGPLLGYEYWSLGSIRGAAAGLGAAIEQVRQRCDADRVDVIGHSMGGVVGRHYAAIDGGAGLRRLITLGSPHGGSAIVRFGIGRARRELCRGSSLLAALAESRLPDGLEMTVIHSPDDVLCGGSHNCEVPGAEVLSVPGVDHLEMLTSGRVARVVIERLGRGSV